MARHRRQRSYPGETNQNPPPVSNRRSPCSNLCPQCPMTARPFSPPTSAVAGHFIFQSNRYSVPYLYASQRLTLKVLPDQLLLFHNEKLVAVHPRSYDRGQRVSHPDHIKELQPTTAGSVSKTCSWLFLNLGPDAEPYGRKLQEKRLNAPHSHPENRRPERNLRPGQVARALQDALRFEAIGANTLPTSWPSGKTWRHARSPASDPASRPARPGLRRSRFNGL